MLTFFTRTPVAEPYGIRTTLELLLLTVTLIAGVGSALAQPAVPASAPKTPSTVLAAAVSGPSWSELSPSQQKILQPLASIWATLEPARKRKWIAMALTYPQQAPAEQEKLQARMADWAALSPRERAVARLNFAETKKLPAAANRAANWDAYQALTPEDKQKFAEKAASAPKGAALSPKQSSPEKVTPVPVTRHTPAEQRAAAIAATPTINRKTLLPQAPQPVKPASASAS